LISAFRLAAWSSYADVESHILHRRGAEDAENAQSFVYMSLRNLCVLCASAVKECRRQTKQGRNREGAKALKWSGLFDDNLNAPVFLASFRVVLAVGAGI
jgi:hypothetical protein